MLEDSIALRRKAEACRQLADMDQSAERKALLAQARRRLGTARDKGREAAPKINGTLGRLSWPPHRHFAWQSRLLSGCALEHVDQTKSKCIDRLLNAQRIL